ncbi:spermidine/putrescine ABC transporter ATP-binding protein [Tepidibacter thalassicus]|uniref:Spermidine/putrescine import ATP-binding protein PotA n=1 Tax=Tepidibacter thalassicus DSM 15285 TaxID=1123350 RepID=A0A1M5P2Y1_9FIRM|nr:spermidine/putrescine ABC transporter ATP-binding protein [Tepidibacter thalassicus]SHG96108.1 spermidine/putrescine transport system ATP-binding protein [Tepidibacter thalassicus DSM 15285]
MTQYIIELKNICKEFEEKKVLNDININIKPKEFVTLLGPSGCGKTTTLRIIGGFENATSGDLYFEGTKINNMPPYKRQINTVFQKYALFPHMNVFDNIAFGLKIKKISKEKIKEKVEYMLKLVNLEGFGKRKISSLSGGQQQRIAIARALICEPKVLLLDEPLGALDLKLRKEMQLELKNMQKKLGITFIYVTHDQEEALTMSDRIIVMSEGKIQQIGTPEDIYNEPKNKFVADFIGESNIIEGIMLSDYKVKIENRVFECLDKGFEKNEEVDIVVRPEDIQITKPENAKIKGVVKTVVFKGVHYEIVVEDEEKVEWIIHTIHMSKAGEKVGLIIEPDAIHVMKKGV